MTEHNEDPAWTLAMGPDGRAHLIHDTDGGTGFRIEAMWAYVVLHGDGDEAIPAQSIGGAMMPMLGADRVRVQALRPLVREMATLLGKPIKLVRFEHRVDEEVIEP